MRPVGVYCVCWQCSVAEVSLHQASPTDDLALFYCSLSPLLQVDCDSTVNHIMLALADFMRSCGWY